MMMSLPTICLVYVLALVGGKERAIRLIGPLVTGAAKASLRYWVPSIQDASQFDVFRRAIRSNIRRWRPLYDVSVVEDTCDIFKINVTNCPFCEVFQLVGLRDMNSYFCQADVKIAEENKGKWIFERTRTIGAGDLFCDHTYRRITSTRQ